MALTAKKSDTRVTKFQYKDETGTYLYIVWSPRRGIMDKEIREGGRLVARDRKFRADHRSYRAQILQAIRLGNQILSSDEKDLMELPPFHDSRKV